MWENADQKSSEYGHFSHSVILLGKHLVHFPQNQRSFKMQCQTHYVSRNKSMIFFANDSFVRINRLFIINTRTSYYPKLLFAKSYMCKRFSEKKVLYLEKYSQNFRGQNGTKFVSFRNF